MLASIFSLNVIQTALELGCIYALVALALFLSYSILNIADLSTDGCFTLGCAVACQVALTGHPFLALLAAMAAGVCSGFITAFLQTRLGVESIMAGIIVNTGLYTINLAVMGFSSTMSLVKTDTVFSIAKSALSFTGGGYKLVLAAVVIALAGADTTARAWRGCACAQSRVVIIEAATSGVEAPSNGISRMSMPASLICTASLLVKPTTASTWPDAIAACCV